MLKYQNTITHAACCAGVGVHSGQKTRLTLLPARPGHGIRFRRSDLGTGEIRAHADNVSGTAYGTSLSHKDGATISTVEHVLAACIGMGLDNVLIEVDGPEVPIMDGSSSVFCELIAEAGLSEQTAVRKIIRILETVEVEDGAKKARISPTVSNELSLKAMIDFENPVIGIQEACLRLVPGAFRRDIGFARTFGLHKDVDMLKSMGLALGGSLENAVLVGEDSVVNPEGLRSQDEFVRHKLLDAVGDLALAGGHIAGLYEAEQPGHSINAALIRKLIDTPSAWCWETMTETMTEATGPVRTSAELAIHV